MKIRSLLFAFPLLTFLANANATEQSERPCTKSDMVGTWTLSSGKNKGNLDSAYQDLAQPLQIRVYGKDNSFKSLSSSKKLSPSQLKELLSISQNESFVVNDGEVATIGNNNQVLERYGCSYFFRDFPAANIKSGTMSLLWFKSDEPYILNTYVRTDLSE